MYELGVSTSGSMAASLDGTRLYTDELSLHRIAADPREAGKKNKTTTSDQQAIRSSMEEGLGGSGSREIWAGLGGGGGGERDTGWRINSGG